MRSPLEQAVLQAGDAVLKNYLPGALILAQGDEARDWMLLSSGAVLVSSRVAHASVAMAAMWRGDLLGWGSPLCTLFPLRSRFELRALVPTTIIHRPSTRMSATVLLQPDEAARYAATDARLQDQVFMRLAGQGLQRLLSALASCAAALAASRPHHAASDTLALPITHGDLGALAGLSRRQAWIYLGQLAEAGWLRTSRSKITLEALSAWLRLPAHVRAHGLETIASVADCGATLEKLVIPDHLTRL